MFFLSNEFSNFISKAIETNTEDRFKTAEEAEKAINALSVLPASEYKEALVSLAKFSVQRNY